MVCGPTVTPDGRDQRILFKAIDHKRIYQAQSTYSNSNILSTSRFFYSQCVLFMAPFEHGRNFCRIKLATFESCHTGFSDMLLNYFQPLSSKIRGITLTLGPPHYNINRISSTRQQTTSMPRTQHPLPLHPHHHPRHLRQAHQVQSFFQTDSQTVRHTAAHPKMFCPPVP